MFLIALAGGRAADRVAISNILVESGKGQLKAFVQATPSPDFAQRRVEILRAALETPSAEGVKPCGSGLVVTHCLTEEEAEVVRSRGGVVWHVYGHPSYCVVIRRGDAIVAEEGAAPAHVLEPLEAFSELLLSRLAGPGAEQTRARIAELANRE